MIQADNIITTSTFKNKLIIKYMDVYIIDECNRYIRSYMRAISLTLSHTCGKTRIMNKI